MSLSGAAKFGTPRTHAIAAAPQDDAANYLGLIDSLVPTITIGRVSGHIARTTGCSGWKVTAANAHAIVMFGAGDNAELLSEPIERLFSVADLPSVGAAIDSALRGAVNADGSLEARTLAGDCFPVRMAASRTGLDSVRLMLAALDAPRAASDRLRASERRYRQLFHGMPIALLRIDAFGSMRLFETPRRKGVTDLADYLDAYPAEFERALDLVRIAEANDHAEKLFGTGESRSMLTSVRPFWEARPDTFRRILCARYSGLRFLIENTVVCGLAGQRVPVLLSQAFPGRDQPQANSLLGMIDISSQVSAEAELQRMQISLADATRASVTSELAASIAHEVSQPLSSMVVNSGTALRWLDRTPPQIERAAARMQSVLEDAERAIDVVKGLRDMSSGVASEHFPLDLNSLVDGALSLVEKEAKTKTVSMNKDLASGTLFVSGVHVQITQLLVNLLMNAIQAIDNAGMVERSILLQTSATSKGEVVIRIGDSGPGIEEAEREQIFHSFYTTKRSGAGMGLAICHSIVCAHGGNISVDRSQAGGALLVVRLPRLPEAPGITRGARGEGEQALPSAFR